MNNNVTVITCRLINYIIIDDISVKLHNFLYFDNSNTFD